MSTYINLFHNLSFIIKFQRVLLVVKVPKTWIFFNSHPHFPFLFKIDLQFFQGVPSFPSFSLNKKLKHSFLVVQHSLKDVCQGLLMNQVATSTYLTKFNLTPLYIHQLHHIFILLSIVPINYPQSNFPYELGLRRKPKYLNASLKFIVNNIIVVFILI